MKRYVLLALMIFCVGMARADDWGRPRKLSAKELQSIDAQVEAIKQGKNTDDCELLVGGPTYEDRPFKGVAWHPKVIDAMLDVIQTSTNTRCVSAAITRLYPPRSPEEVGQQRYDAIVSTLSTALGNADFIYLAQRQLVSMGGTGIKIVCQFHINQLEHYLMAGSIPEPKKFKPVESIEILIMYNRSDAKELIKKVTDKYQLFIYQENEIKRLNTPKSYIDEQYRFLSKWKQFIN